MTVSAIQSGMPYNLVEAICCCYFQTQNIFFTNISKADYMEKEIFLGIVIISVQVCKCGGYVVLGKRLC